MSVQQTAGQHLPQQHTPHTPHRHHFHNNNEGLTAAIADIDDCYWPAKNTTNHVTQQQQIKNSHMNANSNSYGQQQQQQQKTFITPIDIPPPPPHPQHSLGRRAKRISRCQCEHAIEIGNSTNPTTPTHQQQQQSRVCSNYNLTSAVASGAHSSPVDLQHLPSIRDYSNTHSSYCQNKSLLQTSSAAAAAASALQQQHLHKHHQHFRNSDQHLHQHQQQQQQHLQQQQHTTSSILSYKQHLSSSTMQLRGPKVRLMENVFNFS